MGIPPLGNFPQFFRILIMTPSLNLSDYLINKAVFNPKFGCVFCYPEKTKHLTQPSPCPLPDFSSCVCAMHIPSESDCLTPWRNSQPVASFTSLHLDKQPSIEILPSSIFFPLLGLDNWAIPFPSKHDPLVQPRTRKIVHF